MSGTNVKFVLRGGLGDVTCVVPRPPAAAGAAVKQIAVGDRSGLVALWSLVTRRPIVSFCHRPDHDPEQRAEPYKNPHLLSLVFFDANWLATHGRDQTVRVWRLTDVGQRGTTKVDVSPCLFELRVPFVGFCNVVGAPAGPHGGWLVLPEEGGARRLTFASLRWSEAAKDEAATADEATHEWGVSHDAAALPIDTTQKLGMPMALAFVPELGAKEDDDATCLLTAGFEAGHIVLLRFSPREPARASSVQLRAVADPLVSVALRPMDDGALAWGCSATGAFQCHRFTGAFEGDVMRSTLAWEDKIPVGAGHCAAAGRMVLVAAWDGTVRFYDSDSGERVSLLPIHSASANCIAHLHGSTFATGSADGTVAVWDVDPALAEAAGLNAPAAAQDVR